MSSFLRADVWVSSRLPIAVKRLGEDSKFSPISCTLIQGELGAVLVDTPISIRQTQELIEWILEAASGKSLEYIYITHGHGDHWFGIPLLRKKWPNVRILATAGTIESMKTQLAPPRLDGLWKRYFPDDQIAEQTEWPEALPTSGEFEFEGHKFQAIEVGHTDTYDTTILHVPDIRLVVAGDAVYGDVHQFFGEATTTAKRQEWLKALNAIENLDPHIVVAGHKRPGTCDGIFNVRSTREYIQNFEKCVSTSSNWEELYYSILALYPGRVNPHAALAGSIAAFPKS